MPHHSLNIIATPQPQYHCHTTTTFRIPLPHHNHNIIATPQPQYYCHTTTTITIPLPHHNHTTIAAPQTNVRSHFGSGFFTRKSLPDNGIIQRELLWWSIVRSARKRQRGRRSGSRKGGSRKGSGSRSGCSTCRVLRLPRAEPHTKTNPINQIAGSSGRRQSRQPSRSSARSGRRQFQSTSIGLEQPLQMQEVQRR